MLRTVCLTPCGVKGRSIAADVMVGPGKPFVQARWRARDTCSVKRGALSDPRVRDRGALGTGFRLRHRGRSAGLLSFAALVALGACESSCDTSSPLESRTDDVLR